MRDRRGIYVSSWVILISMIVAGSLAVISLEDLVTLEDNIREEALPIVGSRITSSVYSLTAIEQGNIELVFTDDYTVWDTEADRIFLEYGSSEIELQDYTNSLVLEEEGTSDTWCLETRNEIVVMSPGGCS